MMKFYIHYGTTLGIALCACAEVATTSTSTQAGETMQGETMQGMTMQGMRLGSATLGGIALAHVRVERGEVVAERGPETLRGTALVGARLEAEVHNPNTTPPATATVDYRITAVTPEDARYDPTSTGSTYLYTLEQWVDETGSWQPACPADDDGRRVAIPLAAVWDDHGDRSVSPSLFTFGCTTGVIAKCYRWGYRPWVTGYGDLATMHWTCTRLARADYCGIGVPHTRDGTRINVWDNLPPPGPIQHHGGVLPPPGMVFEAGWDTGGAVCLSHARWLLDDGAAIAALCPDRLVPPGLGETVCDTAPSYARMYNESKLNVIGP